jgi:hypothetical protein
MHEERRRELHQWLDQILDQRELLQPSVNALAAFFPAAPQQANSADEARELWKKGIAINSDVLGDAVRSSGVDRLYDNDCEQRELLKGWLWDLYPLLHTAPQGVLGIAPKNELSIFDVLDALSALDAGEIRPLFLANKGKNRRANRWSLARAKLEALVWKKRLRALGYAEKAANFEVTMAFGEQWDTIRKWKPQCEQILGTVRVSASLMHAGSSHDHFTKPRPRGIGAFASAFRLDPMESLKRAGSIYRLELTRSAELAKRKSRMA